MYLSTHLPLFSGVAMQTAPSKKQEGCRLHWDQETRVQGRKLKFTAHLFTIGTIRIALASPSPSFFKNDLTGYSILFKIHIL
jgi:hypothetical protein